MRELRCNTCAEIICVYEEPYEHIDPDLYHCPTCRTPTGEITQLQLDPDTTRVDNIFGYRPDLAEIPF